MARLPRVCAVGIPQHVIQRGNNRQVCFASEQDFAAYANWLKEYAKKFQMDLHAWVLMTNHVHLLCTPRVDNAVSHLMQALGRQYVRYFNFSYKRTGTLWEGRFKSCLVQQEAYLLQLYRYNRLYREGYTLKLGRQFALPRRQSFHGQFESTSNTSSTN